jgi:hypothetical protein
MRGAPFGARAVRIERGAISGVQEARQQVGRRHARELVDRVTRDVGGSLVRHQHVRPLTRQEIHRAQTARYASSARHRSEIATATSTAGAPRWVMIDV